MQIEWAYAGSWKFYSVPWGGGGSCLHIIPEPDPTYKGQIITVTDKY